MRPGDEGWSGIHWPVAQSGEGLGKIIEEMIDYCIFMRKYEIRACIEKPSA